MWLSTVILNYNSEAFLERCLRSIRQCCAHHTPEIVVVDNGSHQVRTARRICSEFGVDLVVENRANIGVAAARNQGVRMSSGDLVCTLDVDTILTPGAFDELAKVARDATVGVCGPQLRFPDGRLQRTCRRFPTIYTKLLRLRPGCDFFGALEVEEMRAADHSMGMQVDWVIGACQAYSRRTFEDLDGYTVFSRFGFEDVDLCLRAWLSGKRVLYVPSAIVFHDEQRVARGRNRALTASHLVSLIRYFGAHRYGFGRDRLYRRIAERNPYFTHTMDASPIAAGWERNLAASGSAIMGQFDEAGRPNSGRDAAAPTAGPVEESEGSRDFAELR